MDFEDGQVLCKTGISVDGTKLDETLIENIVAANLLIIERHREYIIGVIKV